jgi:hypothetical protein
MSGRSKILLGIALLASLAWIIGFILVDGASWRKVSDDEAEDFFLQCMDQKKGFEACDAERDANTAEMYSGIPWGGIVFLAVAPVAVCWAGGLLIWFVRRKLKSKPSASA